MKLNHINLTVTDVKASTEFFEKYFGLRHATGNQGIAIMMDENNSVIAFMKAREVEYPKTFHIGFIRENKEQVNHMHQQLKEDGFEVEEPRHFHGSWTFYFTAPGGVLVEVQCLERSEEE